jgi:hypothetical protein
MPKKVIIFLLLASVTFNFIQGLFILRTSTERGNESIKGAAEIQLLTSPIQLAGSKEIKKLTIPLDPGTLQDKDTFQIVLNLNGLCLLPALASQISFIDINNKFYSLSLKDYAKNCFNGQQTITVPLSNFFQSQNTPEVNSLEIQLWYPTNFTVDISSISVRNNVLAASTKGGGKNPRPIHVPKTSTPTPIPVATPIVTPSPSPVGSPVGISGPSWLIQSVSSMKETKDKVCNPDNATFINQWVNMAIDLGVNYVAVETPYDNPTCGDSLAYTKAWADDIHSKGLNVWHRHMPLAFEGIYSTPKNSSNDYLNQIYNYIIANPTLFKAGDIFTPIAEPQNGGINGITYCANGICIFSGAGSFNTWLRDAMTISQNAFSAIGLGGGQVKIGYYGFDGFVAWGDNNPDWHGILEDSTIAMMGNITIDHYPEIVGDTMENDLNELQARYPNTPIIIGEWGTITGGDVQSQVLTSMQAAKRPNVVGFNYWHMGMGGNEALILDGFVKNIQFDEVQSFYK